MLVSGCEKMVLTPKPDALVSTIKSSVVLRKRSTGTEMKVSLSESNMVFSTIVQWKGWSVWVTVINGCARVENPLIERC